MYVKYRLVYTFTNINPGIGSNLIVGVTAEVSLLELPDKKFLREPDPETGFKELVIK